MHPISSFFRTNLFLLTVLLISFQSFAEQSPEIQKESNPRDTLIIGYAGSEPFNIHTENQWSGISPEIWEALHIDKKLIYKKRAFPDVSKALQALRLGKIDVVVGPTSITSSRAKDVEFTQPYFQSSLSILSRVDDASLWDRIAPFFSAKLLYAILAFLGILACVGTLLWLAERKKSPEQFPVKPIRGIGTGMWCAIVTMSTTGYGDIAPITLLGRVVAGTWMVVSLLFATSMVAGIASTLTITGMGSSTISTAEQMQNKKIAVLKSSPAVEFVREHKGKLVYVQNLKQGYQMLKNKKVAALVFDRPQLLYYLQKHPNSNMVVSIAQYQKQGYGFAFDLNSDRVHDMNVELLRIKENGRLSEIISYYLGKQTD